MKQREQQSGFVAESAPVKRNPVLVIGCIVGVIALALVVWIGSSWIRISQRRASSASSANASASVAATPGSGAKVARSSGGTPTRRKSSSADGSKPITDTQLSLVELMLGMKSGKMPKLTPEQVEAWLAKAGRSVENLLAASRLVNDPALLAEAAKNFPNDPRVQMEVLLKNAFPEDRQRWIEALKQSSPDNALPNYLAARDLMKAGKQQQALQELLAAAGKPGVDTFLFDLQPATQSAWSSSGYPTAVGQLMSTFGAQGQAVGSLNEIANQMATMADKLRQSGDAATAQSLATAGLKMGEGIAGDGRTFLSEVVGMGVQMRFLQQMNPDAVVPGSTQTAAALQAQIKERQTTLITLAKSFDESTPLQVNDREISGYFQRLRSEGEFSAMQWLRNRIDNR